VAKKTKAGQPPSTQEIRKMLPQTDRLTPEAKEYRRKRALELLELGWQQSAIALALGVTQGAVSQWARAVKAGDGLDARTSTGRPGQLTDEQMGELRDRIRGVRPTARDLVELIRVFYNVSYSVAHASRILNKLKDES
jgi:transposase